MTTVIELVREIEKLRPEERVRIVARVIRDVMRPDPDIEAAWAQEASSRWAAYQKGDLRPIPYDEVMSKYKQS
jgi:putative addiction module component (TIGR02574 family)